MQPDAEQIEELRKAYREVFLSNGKLGEMVMTDLADWCGWNKVLSQPVAHDLLVDHNARQSCFGRIFFFLEMTEEERKGLNAAIRLKRMNEDY